jgi:hypothetical protein
VSSDKRKGTQPEKAQAPWGPPNASKRTILVQIPALRHVPDVLRTFQQLCVQDKPPNSVKYDDNVNRVNVAHVSTISMCTTSTTSTTPIPFARLTLVARKRRKPRDKTVCQHFNSVNRTSVGNRTQIQNTSSSSGHELDR